MEKELPAGWVWSQIGEVAETSLGKMLDKAKSTGQYATPYLRNVNVQWGRIDLDDILTMDILPAERDFYRLRDGDLLVCEGGEIGRCAIWRGGSQYMAYQKALHRIRPSDAVTVGYLRYYLEHLALNGTLAKFSTGSTIKHLPQQRIREIPLAIPPVAEQHRIVDTLEDHLSRLDSGTAGLSRTSRRLVQLNQQLIRSAVEVNGESREETSLGAVATTVKNGIFVSRPDSEPSGVPILRIGAVRTLHLDTSDVRYTGLDEDSPAVVNALLSPGDLLFTRYNGNPEYVGACAVVPDSIAALTYPDKLIRVIVDREKALPEYVALACSGGTSRQYIRQCVKTTAGQAGISGREIRSVPLSLPSLEEQQRRIDRYRETSTAVAALRGEISKATVRARHLQSALLARTFSGRLVPQDPTDASAAQALARVQAERATRSSLKRTRRPRVSKPAAAYSPPPPSAATPLPATAVQQEFEL
ncbi:restriction endonuclease subunit S [Streptomyces kroppenstedtii]|uniref:restriction endonuclease subunit S n=1 Tax=Streptomyces kroppenstedtii TaxID=3051181 RepID=UPI0028D32908|nr:restriction endonuclease subunit S [Streptomyces sp. DSM 40484]